MPLKSFKNKLSLNLSGSIRQEIKSSTGDSLVISDNSLLIEAMFGIVLKFIWHLTLASVGLKLRNQVSKNFTISNASACLIPIWLPRKADKVTVAS